MALRETLQKTLPSVTLPVVFLDISIAARQVRDEKLKFKLKTVERRMFLHVVSSSSKKCIAETDFHVYCCT